MATASSVVGSLQVNITAGTSGIEKGLQSTSRMLEKFSGKASLVGGAITAGFGAALKMFESNGSQLEELSSATGIAVEQLSFLKYAAVQSGAGIEELTKAARGLITKGIDPSRFEEIATKIAAIQDPVERAQSAMYFFGKKSALALLPLINDLPKLKTRFGQLGGGFTGKMADTAKALGQSWGNVQLVLANVTNHIAFALAPSITKISNYIADNGQAIVGWIDDHQKLILIVGGVAGALAGLAPILFGLNQAIKLASSGIGGLKFIMGGLPDAFKFLSQTPSLIALTAIGSAAIDLTSIFAKLQSGAISAYEAAAQGLNSLGGVGGFLPKIQLPSNAISDGPAPGIVPSIAAPPNIGAMPNIGATPNIAQGVPLGAIGVAQNVRANLTANGGISPGGGKGDGSAEDIKRAADALDALLKVMQGKDDQQQTPTPTAPVQLAVAGVR
jgi:hypothetical protein